MRGKRTTARGLFCPGACWASIAVTTATALSALALVAAAALFARNYEVGFCDGTCLHILPRAPLKRLVMPWPDDFPGCNAPWLPATSAGAPAARIIHQTWKTATSVPRLFRRTSDAWKRLHPGWQHVLWTDKSNRELVAQKYPHLLPFYDSLPREILRVDVVRFLYLHAYGGVYADMDVEPLRAVDQHVFEAQITLGYLGSGGNSSWDDDDNRDSSRRHAIPNALMASRQPGHPFWLAAVAEAIKRSATVAHMTEAVAGPIMLTDLVNAWNAKKCKCASKTITVHPPGVFFPYDWSGSGSGSRSHDAVCSMGSKAFDAAQCRAAFPDAVTITYWAHSWKGTNAELVRDDE